MNILLVTDYVLKSGVGMFVVNLSKMLKTMGHTVVVIGSRNELIDENEIKFIEVDLTARNPLNIMKNVKIIGKIIKDYKIDIVHTNHRLCSFNMRLYNLLHRIPVVWSLHTAPLPCRLRHRMITYHGKMAIAVSTEVREFAIDKLKIRPCEVTTTLNGVDKSKLIKLTDNEISEYKSALGILSDKKVFGMHGRLDVVKGIDLLIQAIATLDDHYRDQFVVVCSGDTSVPYYNTIKELLKEFKLTDMFYFTGWVETRDIMSISDIIIQPSRREGFPLVVSEAFLMGVPVIRTKVGGFKDVEGYCIGIEPNNIGAIALGMADYLDDKNDYEEMADRAYEFANSKLTIEAMTSSILNVYHDVLSQKRHK